MKFALRVIHRETFIPSPRIRIHHPNPGKTSVPVASAMKEITPDQPTAPTAASTFPNPPKFRTKKTKRVRPRIRENAKKAFFHFFHMISGPILEAVPTTVNSAMDFSRPGAAESPSSSP